MRTRPLPKASGARQIQCRRCRRPVRRFPRRRTRTIFEKAEVVLWRGPDAFRVEVWRSFARYVLALLQAADRDVP